MFTTKTKVKLKRLEVRSESDYDPESILIKSNYIGFLENIYNDVIKSRHERTEFE